MRFKNTFFLSYWISFNEDPDLVINIILSSAKIFRQFTQPTVGYLRFCCALTVLKLYLYILFIKLICNFIRLKAVVFRSKTTQNVYHLKKLKKRKKEKNVFHGWDSNLHCQITYESRALSIRLSKLAHLKPPTLLKINSDGFLDLPRPRISAKVFALPGHKTSLPSNWHQKSFYDSNW